MQGVGEFKPVEGRLKFEPTAWYPRSGAFTGLRASSPKNGILEGLRARNSAIRTSAETGYLAFRRLVRLTAISPVATPRQAPLTDRLKPPPLLMYID